MAYTSLYKGKMTIGDMIKRLCEMNEPAVNDERQDKYCKYITIFSSHYKHGDKIEEVRLVGSTKEGLRLRVDRDEGDFDYLANSWIEVPTECLEFREDLPCFVHIKGERVLQQFDGTVTLLDGTYLPNVSAERC